MSPMIARAQQLLIIMLVAAAIGWCSYVDPRESPYIAVVGGLAILSGYAGLLAAQFIASAIVNSGETSQWSVGRRVVALWREFAISLRVFSWWQPFRSNAIPDLPIPIGAEQRGVVLVHGLACNRGFWIPWMEALRARHIPFLAVNLEPPFASIDDYGGTIDQAVRRLLLTTGKKPLVVAHSMGGLAVRAWLCRWVDAQRILHHVVTIGTPHAGTCLARFSWATNGKQMRIKGAWLEQLREVESEEAYCRFTCFYSDFDNVVFPMQTGMLPGADNRRVDGAGHVRLAYEPSVYDEVIRLVAEP